MKIEQYQIDQHNDSLFSRHNNQFIFLQEQLGEQGINAKDIVKALEAFQVAIPSWALGTGGTRFGRFSASRRTPLAGRKIEDVGLLHALNRSSGSISLHIPWDIPGQARADHRSGNVAGFNIRCGQFQYFSGPEGPGAFLQIRLALARGREGAQAGGRA
jgi:L-rhamnose isomerase